MSYVAIDPDDLELGDVVRRNGDGIRIGVVVGVRGEHVLVRWRKDGPIDRRHHKLLQRRADRSEIRVEWARA